VKADEALAMGLVNQVVADDSVVSAALALAAELATRPALAVQAAKRAIDAGLDTDIDGGIAIEEGAFAGLFGTEDRVIGMRTFVESGPGKARFLHR
jgi:enoyl-CoA hydratase/carnithine racemase